MKLFINTVDGSTQELFYKTGVASSVRFCTRSNIRFQKYRLTPPDKPGYGYWL